MPDISSFFSSTSENGCHYQSNSPGSSKDDVGSPVSRRRHQPEQQQQQQQASPKSVFFSPANKISAYSLERRIDFHLQRIMKRNRLINFKNSIESLPIEERIYESLLEIILSSNSLIARRQTLLSIGMNIIEAVAALLMAGDVEAAHLYLFGADAGAIATLKHISASLGQLAWALNSNKEHVKYVGKVWALPDIYERANRGNPALKPSSSLAAGVCSKDFGASVQLKERIEEMVAVAEATIARCEQLKALIHDSVLATALAMATLEQEEKEKKMMAKLELDKLTLQDQVLGDEEMLQDEDEEMALFTVATAITASAD